ncbi:MAG TPA: acetate/propionate family kinase [Acetobacteraceae bacterium]|nr:acetate/propionate family kinase [Acetobacteraceae bacterium]
MPEALLSLNAGSSSIKFALFEINGERALNRAAYGQIEAIGRAPHFLARDAAGNVLEDARGSSGSHESLLSSLLGFVEEHLGGDRLRAVGHRVVHGGTEFIAPAVVTDAVLSALEALTPLAPLHQPHNIAPIRAVAATRPGLPQVACFDTAFHHTMPLLATRFALPREYETQGVRRYGFHGLSYEFIARHLAREAPRLAAGRVIVAHLGNGASLCAMRDGRSVDTTMGFTALDGLMMGTRCGTIDPGVVLHLIEQRGMDAKMVADLLYNRSGLLGVSGISNDMRTLLGSDDERAREAVRLFVFRIAREAGALVSTLDGLDGLVFTAGIGEHAPPIRQMACERLGWLGVRLSAAANSRGEAVISTPDSPIEVRVIPTDEEAMIAHHTLEALDA